MTRPAVQWVTQEHSWVGNAYGYNSHNSNMRRFISGLVDLYESAPVALSIVPADQFVPVPGKLNVLFTMFETLDIPDSYVKGINRADVIVVPCRFCRDIFARYTNKPIHVCFEGVDEDFYKYYQRSVPRLDMGGKFRLLWCGAPNPRKGYPLVLEAIKAIEHIPWAEVYLKTTVQDIGILDTARNIWKNRRQLFAIEKGQHIREAAVRAIRRMPRPGLSGKVARYGRHQNIVMDTRRLSAEGLRDLYNSAHVFLFPTFGEGWGLTLCEAMATGAPCIATPVTGCADFFDESVGYPINYDIKKINLENYDLTTDAHVPQTLHFIEQIKEVIGDYETAIRKGKRASDRIRGKFTWRKAAERLAEIIQDIELQEVAK